MLISDSAWHAGGAAAGAVAGGMTVLAGADPIGLVLGMAAAVLVTFIHGKIDSRAKAFCGVMLAALLSGYGAPVAAQVLLVQFPAYASAISIALPLISLIIGWLSPTGVVVAIEWVRRKGESI